jgi:gliding motility-associated-like protein
VSCDTCLSTEIILQEDKIMNIVLTHKSGCSFTREFKFERKEKSNLIIPNVICVSCSSNNIWKLDVPAGITIRDVMIYDRWGNKVAEYEAGKVIEWDGTMNGRKLETGVYTYRIRYNDTDDRLTLKVGDVTIVR